MFREWRPEWHHPKLKTKASKRFQVGKFRCKNWRKANIAVNSRKKPGWNGTRQKFSSFRLPFRFFLFVMNKVTWHCPEQKCNTIAIPLLFLPLFLLCSAHSSLDTNTHNSSWPKENNSVKTNQSYFPSVAGKQTT